METYLKHKVLKNIITKPVVVVHTFRGGAAGAGRAVSLRSACSTEGVPRQPRPQRETLALKKANSNTTNNNWLLTVQTWLRLLVISLPEHHGLVSLILLMGTFMETEGHS